MSISRDPCTFISDVFNAIRTSDQQRLANILELNKKTGVALSQEDAHTIMLDASAYPDLSTLSLLESYGVVELSYGNNVIMEAMKNKASVSYVERLSAMGFPWSKPGKKQALMTWAIIEDHPEYIEPALRNGVPAFIEDESINPLHLLIARQLARPRAVMKEWMEAAGCIIAYGGRIDLAQLQGEETVEKMAETDPIIRQFLAGAMRHAAAIKAAIDIETSGPSDDQRSGRPRL